jgi:hypothetical protein
LMNGGSKTNSGDVKNQKLFFCECEPEPHAAYLQMFD